MIYYTHKLYIALVRARATDPSDDVCGECKEEVPQTFMWVECDKCKSLYHL